MAAQLPICWHVRGPWSIAIRPEIAHDSDGRWTLAQQTIKALTSTLEYRVAYKWASTMLRLEYRLDDSRGTQGGFFAAHEVLPGVLALTPTQHLIVLGVIFTFDSSSSQ